MSTTEYRQPTHREELERVLLSGASAQIAHAPENAAAIAKGIKTVLDELALKMASGIVIPPIGSPSAGTTTASLALPVIERPDTLVLPEIERPDTLNLCIQKHNDERTTKTGTDLAAHDVVTGLALRGLKEVDSLEREIQAKANKGPRVTPGALQAEIVSEHYFTAGEGIAGRCFREVSALHSPRELELLTFCVLVLRNGFTVHGVSACASPENYNNEIGQRIARENAEREIWPLLGFRLRDELARPVLTEADALADLAGEPRPS